MQSAQGAAISWWEKLNEGENVLSNGAALTMCAYLHLFFYLLAGVASQLIFKVKHLSSENLLKHEKCWGNVSFHVLENLT